MNLKQLEKQAMFLEIKYERFLRTHNYLGKNSPVAKLHEELNAIWKEISRQSRLKNSLPR